VLVADADAKTRDMTAAAAATTTPVLLLLMKERSFRVSDRQPALGAEFKGACNRSPDWIVAGSVRERSVCI
jgi:hypothetical protein